MIQLILGGARSGKSQMAERLAATWTDAVTYVATGVVPDDDADFAARVEAHRRRRPSHWRTVEAGAGLIAAVSDTGGGLLIDSLGTWVANTPDFAVDADGLCGALRLHEGPILVVSEEVGLGVHPASEAGRRFRDALGQLNQEVAAVAADAWLMVAGRALPLGPV